MRPAFATSAVRSAITNTPSGAILSAGPQILFDGRTSLADSAELWDTVGTGTATFQTNKMNMAVGAGQYLVRQGRRAVPYYSGYPLMAELTFDNMGVEAGVLKRVGYFSSSTTAPYTANLDGFALEMDGLTYRLKAWNNGTLTVNEPLADWNGDRKIDFDFSKFSAVAFDFLWLGGAALRLWICTAQGGWELAAVAPYIGESVGPMTRTAQHALRYEIRSSIGTGSMRAICSQVSVVGDVSDKGFSYVTVNPTSLSCNSVGTTYVLQGFKLNATYNDVAAEFVNIACIRTNTSADVGVLLLLRNPTLSAPLVYTASSRYSQSYATNQTVTALGSTIVAEPVSTASTALVDGNYRRWMHKSIGGTFDEYVLAYRPLSANQAITGIATVKEH